MCDFRAIGRENRKKLSIVERENFTRTINDYIFQTISDYNNIMIYNHFDGEVEIFKVFAKNFIFPKIKDDVIIPCTGNTFVKGKYGISEPDGEVFSGKIDAFIVPMCAYDSDFNRIGFGKGYYDRFLADKDGIKIGVAFSCQECYKIIPKKTDIKMDIIITEKGVLKRR